MSEETKQFKTLTHCGAWVDTSLLEKGIYTSHRPHLYDSDLTIDTLIKISRTMKDITGASFLSDRYFENLSKCQLSDVYVSPQPPIES